MRPAYGRRAAVLFYLSYGLVRVCEIELYHMGKTAEIAICLREKAVAPPGDFKSCILVFSADHFSHFTLKYDKSDQTNVIF